LTSRIPSDIFNKTKVVPEPASSKLGLQYQLALVPEDEWVDSVSTEQLALIQIEIDKVEKTDQREENMKNFPNMPGNEEECRHTYGEKKGGGRKTEDIY